MVNPKRSKTDVGVLVGRFQVPELHEGHKRLIQDVIDEHGKVIIFLGLSPCRVSRNNPLDFESRKQMILNEFPEVNVLYIKDMNSDDRWSKKLDEQIEDLVGPTSTVTLYGGRESFIAHYNGKYECCEVEQEVYVSGEEIRKQLSAKVKASQEFREGVIWAAFNQYPKAIPTVDVAIWDEEYKKLLMARKKDEKLYRFVGGFARAEEYEQTAKREVAEETHLEVDGLQYIGSHKVDDWRYRREVDKIVTILFEAKRVFGRPTPDDDIHELRWFDVEDLCFKNLVLEHRPLLKMLLEKSRFYKNNKKIQEKETDVHTEHCCVNCGCKYGDENCTVTNKNRKQSYKCGMLEVCGAF